jgi:hypothetical protein
MRRRRKDDGLEALALPIAFLIFFFGAAVVAFLQAIVLIALILACTALVGAIAVYLVRAVWRRQTAIDSFLPDIDWEVPAQLDQSDRLQIELVYPLFPQSNSQVPPHVIGTSGAWKDVLVKTEMIAPFRGVATPRELKERVFACELASKDIFAESLKRISESVTQNLDQHLADIDRTAESANVLRQRIRPKLDELEDSIAALNEGNYFDRVKSRRLGEHFAVYHATLISRCSETRPDSERQRERLGKLMEPAEREKMVAKQIRDDLAMIKAIIQSSEFAGAR